MAAVTISTEAQIQTVLESTKTTNTCSESTLRLLSALLGINDTESNVVLDRSAIRAPRHKQAATVTTIKPTKNPARRINAKFTVLDSADAPIQCLSRNRQLQLATTTFNTTLKTLGAASKAKHSARSRTPGQLRSPLKETQGRIRDLGKPTSKAVPSNYVDSKSQGSQGDGAQHTLSSSDRSDLLATAECARTSLRYLRHLKVADITATDRDTQLEHGALVLISKLQGVGLIAAAIEETLTLRQTLDNVLGRRQRGSKNGKGCDSCSSYSSLVDCIEFEHFGGSGGSFGLVTAFQIQVLQLIGLDTASSIGQNFHQRLDPANSRSPCRIVLRGVEQGWVSSEKAAHQVHALCQCLLSICSPASQSAAEMAGSNVSPIEQFRLQSLALQMRCHWWRLAKHQPDFEKEIWTPFHHFVVSLHRRTGNTTKFQFLLVKGSLEQLVDMASKLQNDSTSQQATIQPSSIVICALQSMAEATGSTKDSLDLLQGLKGVCANLSGLLAAIYHCKVASAMLPDCTTQTENYLSTIADTLDALGRPLKGTTRELEQLLLEASRLRKAATSRLTAISATSETEYQQDDGNKPLASTCVRAIFGVLHFVLRYANFKPQSNREVGCSSKCPSKVLPSPSVAQQSLRSTLAAVQLNITYDYVGWELCILALADCLSITEIMNENAEDISNPGKNTENTLTTSVRVSNLYWSYYLKQKDAGACARNLASTLTRSIEALEGRTQSEKQTGFLAIKCEKAAVLYIELKQFKRARQDLVTAIKTHIVAGSLSAAARESLTRPARQVWEEADSAQLMLGRLLTAHARLFLKHQPDSSPSSGHFFDEAELKPDQRALLLEKQFVALGESSVPEILHPCLKNVADTILSLYNESGSPLHRMRFVSQLLGLSLKNRLCPRHFLPEQALKICTDGSSDEAFLGEKSSITSFRSLHASVSLQWSFSTTAPSVSLLQDFVASHAAATQSCDNWASLLSSINDPMLVMAQIQSVIDFTDMQGLWQIKLDALLLMRSLLELQSGKDISALASCTTQIGLQYTRMGQTSKAGHVLASAEKLITKCQLKTLVALKWHLAYAEYLTALSSYEKATDHLVSAQWRYDVDFVAEQEHESQGSRLAQNKYLAQAAFIASNLAFEIGDLDIAILHAKRGIKISVRQWTAFERLLGVESPSRIAEEVVPKLDLLTKDMSKMTITAGGEPKNLTGKGAAFWTHVYMHFNGLLHLSRLSAYCGSFQDAVYYAEQAKKVADATLSDALRSRASAVLAVHFAQAGDFDRAQMMVDQCTKSCGAVDHAVGSLQVLMAVAGAYLITGELERGMQAVRDAQKAIYDIQETEHSFFSSDSAKARPVMAASVGKTPRSARRVASKARIQRPPNSVVRSGVHADVKEMSTEKVMSATGSSTWAQRLQAEVNLLRSRFCVRTGSYENAETLLDQVAALARSPGTEASYYVLQATLKLTHALRLLQSDAVYSVLAESTIAYPTQQRKATDDLQNESIVQRDPATTAVATPSRLSKKAASKIAASHDRLSKPRELVSKARELLVMASSSPLPAFSFTFADELFGLLTQAQLLSSLLSAGPAPSPIQITYHLNAPQSLRWHREVASLTADTMLVDKSTAISWPEMRDFRDAELASTNAVVDCTDLQPRLIYALPSSWNVVTIGLSDDSAEILLSKITKAQPPFLLRLPLHRTSSEDLDEESFSFQTARSELLDIIANANLTAHDTKARSDRRGKKDWWTARESLDARLLSLLNNIETLWLGGFRGIFSDERHNEELLSRFSESLSRTLDRQLPSRRKVGVKTESSLQLHSHVLELFIALGDPDEGDLDDAITDLLYFVIDIFQFQGERNAYDEVDFDAMVVEVNDSLRSYHDAVKDAFPKRDGHTILILDKALHAFPWESLRCLEGQSVTRMPSLSCLQERLSRLSQNDEGCPGICIDARNGAYILNPSSDLTSTEETFLDTFSSTLTDYTSIVNRAPSETEFEMCLREKELCLYFGHGSGAQFIRGRTIKRLHQCAVTFLMGCSSSKMVECGQFEPYGVPYNYLHGGSAAVVGTLWDVTDKDIDRFAMGTFVNWGLLNQDTVKEDSTSRARKMKGKGKGPKQKEDSHDKNIDESRRGEVGLDEAVAKARSACVLRYLNGAAPVIYGVPVYLK
jgi:separase